MLKIVSPMRVLLISANTETLNMPTLPMGLGCVAAAAQRTGHQVTLLDLMAAADPDAAAKGAAEAARPDVIGISIRNIDDQNMARPKFLLDRAKATVAACRKASAAPIVLGGAGYSIYPESALAYTAADMGIQGEGEAAFLALLHRIDTSADLSGLPGLYLKAKGLQGKRRFIRDLDVYPVPGPELMHVPEAVREKIWLPFQTRRGCGLKCSYCSTPAIEGGTVRPRSPKEAVKALSCWAAAGFSNVYFVDNTFNLPPAYAEALCEAIGAAGLKITWRCILYPGKVTPSLVEAMKAAGCTEVSLGFESGSDTILRWMNKRFEKEDIRKTSRLLSDAGIRQMGFLLLGGPAETKATVSESLSFVDSLPLDALKITLGIRIYPNTALARQAVEEGGITADDDLLFPVFYLKKELDPWLRETVDPRVRERHTWMY